MSYEPIKFDHYQPSRLLQLTHPAWSVRRRVHPLFYQWKRYLDDAKDDPSVVVLVVDCVTRMYDDPGVSDKVKDNIKEYIDWFDEIKEIYSSRVAIWATGGQDPNKYRGLLRPDENSFHKEWLMEELNIKPDTIKLPFPIFGRTYSTFYQIDYHGVGVEDDCAWTQMGHLRDMTYLEQRWDLRGYER